MRISLFLRGIFIPIFILIFAQSFGQTKKITGKVTSSVSGTPIEGVSIQVKGTKSGTTTNKDGVFTLNAGNDAILLISSVGFETQEVNVDGQTNIAVQLKESSDKLT